MNIQTFSSSQQLVVFLSDELQKLSELRSRVNIALSGGTTPKRWFDYLAASRFRETIDWQRLHFWWGDERCVGPEHPESNFGQADGRLFKKVMVAPENVHRILGEDDPDHECLRLDQAMRASLPVVNGLPQFDWVLLGIGEDGHTASLFPHQYDPETKSTVVHAHHPVSGQSRISITAPVITNARRVTYLALGESKQAIVKKVLETPEEAAHLPAATIRSLEGDTEFYLDSEAASGLAQG